MKNFKKTLRVLLILSFGLFSCESDIEEQLNTETVINHKLKKTLEAEQLDNEGPEVSKILFGTTVKVISLGENYYALGDMILSEDNFDQDKGESKGTWYNGFKKWPDNTIRYRHSRNMPEKTKENIKNAAEYITKKTNLTVRKWDKNKDQDLGYVWISYNEDNGCSAQVGYRNEQFPGQKMNLSTKCSYGSTIHEFLHVAGVLHEQSHWDRNNYITINWDNIIEKYHHNFYKFKKVDQTSTTKVDINSIMMYGSTYFRTDKAIEEGKWSIETKEGYPIIPNRSYMTPKDIEIINKVYTSLPCSTIQWSTWTIYSKGDIVSYNGYKYEAQSSGLHSVTPGTSWWWKQIGKCD